MPAKNTEISVIVPAYNRANLVEETLASILSQTLKPAEIIVIDDGSTDNTAEVVRNFPVIYHRQENSGSPVARNTGISLAKSNWIALCDSDDLWRPTFLEKSMKALAEAGAEYCFGNFRHVRDGVWEEEDKFSTVPPGLVIDPNNTLYPLIIQWQPIFPSTVVFSRPFFYRVGGFDIRLARSVTEDFEFTLRCVHEYPVAVVWEALVGIRKHDGNVSGNSLRMHQGDIEILRFSRDNHPLGRRYADLINREIARRSTSAARLAYDQGQWKALIAHYKDVSSPDWKLRIKRLIAGVRTAGMLGD